MRWSDFYQPKSIFTKVVGGATCIVIAGTAAVICGPMAAVLVGLPSIVGAQIFLNSALEDAKGNSIALEASLRKQFSEDQIRSIYEQSRGTTRDAKKEADTVVAGSYLGMASFAFNGLAVWFKAISPKIAKKIEEECLIPAQSPCLTTDNLGKIMGAAGTVTLCFSLHALRTINMHQQIVMDKAAQFENGANSSAAANAVVAANTKAPHQRGMRRHK